MTNVAGFIVAMLLGGVVFAPSSTLFRTKGGRR